VTEVFIVRFLGYFNTDETVDGRTGWLSVRRMTERMNERRIKQSINFRVYNGYPTTDPTLYWLFRLKFISFWAHINRLVVYRMLTQIFLIFSADIYLREFWNTYKWGSVLYYWPAYTQCRRQTSNGRWRLLSSSSVTLLAGGPIVLRPVRATPCFINDQLPAAYPSCIAMSFI